MVNNFATIELGDKTFTIAFDLNSLEALEQHVEGSAFDSDFWAKITQPFTARSLLLLFWAGLRSYHPEITLEEAGALVNPQNMAVVMKAVHEAECAMAAPAPVGA